MRLRHIKFYTTLLLKDMLTDQFSYEKIQHYYGLSTGEFQSFQQRCSAFAPMVVTFCKELKWWNIYNLLSQYMDRINFVVQEELQELLQLTQLDPCQARAIYEAGFTSIYPISKSRPIDIMKALQKTFVQQRQFSDNWNEYFTKGCEDQGLTTLTRAEEIIEGAKKIMKKRSLAKAREIHK
eukprot:CAMPEP_0170563034 /NCGR_PEP_ID=MMETSP0211-20121228/63797_1 /TAXON_ID=311385 /ORGANISM="Pseudokeronopsis sp., Strain OXSARD2" /LENGTH=180 /DNA_ID=CAMNT_0010880695 /DNA_START=1 /DNA_END=540 /DNA_ORIENTATION=+